MVNVGSQFVVLLVGFKIKHVFLTGLAVVFNKVGILIEDEFERTLGFALYLFFGFIFSKDICFENIVFK